MLSDAVLTCTGVPVESYLAFKFVYNTKDLDLAYKELLCLADRAFYDTIIMIEGLNIVVANG